MKTYINRKRLIPAWPIPSVFCLLYSAFCILSGCRQHESSVPKTAVSDLSDSVKKAEVMLITRDVLAQMHFEIEKLDSELGYIQTRPLEGAQFFEFWRSDNIGTQNWLLGNLHSIRRTVEISIDPVLRSSTTTKDEKYIDCAVHIQRLSMPEQEVTSSARAYSMFSRSSPALQTLRLNPEQQRDTQWIDLGRDKELEKEIIKRIYSMLDVRRSSFAIQYRESSIE